MTPAPDSQAARRLRIRPSSRALLHRCAANARRTFAASPHDTILHGLGILLLVVLVVGDVKSPIGSLSVLGVLWALGQKAGAHRARASHVEPAEPERGERSPVRANTDRDHQEASWKSEH